MKATKIHLPEEIEADDLAAGALTLMEQQKMTNDPLEDIRDRVAEALRQESIIRDHLQMHERNVAKGKPGNCFGIAFWLALAVDQTLVHAALNRPPICVTHAWVLFDETVIVDLTQDLYCNANDFPHHIHVAYEFSGKPRLREMMSKSKDYGPWNEGLRNLNDTTLRSFYPCNVEDDFSRDS